MGNLAPAAIVGQPQTASRRIINVPNRPTGSQKMAQVCCDCLFENSKATNTVIDFAGSNTTCESTDGGPLVKSEGLIKKLLKKIFE